MTGLTLNGRVKKSEEETKRKKEEEAKRAAAYIRYMLEHQAKERKEKAESQGWLYAP